MVCYDIMSNETFDNYDLSKKYAKNLRNRYK